MSTFQGVNKIHMCPGDFDKDQTKSKKCASKHTFV